MNNSTKKRSVRLVAALLAIVMVIGGTFAFFTDSASINKSGNAGTVDVELDATGINLLDEDGKLILNPGDGRDVDFTVNNKGNKSVDIRTIITLTSSVGMAKDGQAEYEIYKLGDVEFVDGKGYMPKEGAQPLQVRSISEDGRTIVYQTPIYILNGNEELDDMEREIEPDVATDIDPYFDVSEGGSSANSKYVLVFKGSSANAFQASDVTLNVHIDAKQHRNQNGWVEVGNDDTEVPGVDEDQETYNVQYVVSGIDDATLVIPYLSSSLTDDTSKFYAGVETGCYVDPNTNHADWHGEVYEVTDITVTTKSGTSIELDENGRFTTPAEDIIVTITVDTATNIARVYNTNRQHIGDYPRLDEAFEVAELTAAEDAANTTSTYGRTILAGLIPTAFAEPEVNVYVELLTDYTLVENIVLSTPYTITFTSNEAMLNATGKDRFTLTTGVYDMNINVSSVSTMEMKDIIIDTQVPEVVDAWSITSYIVNNGTFYATNTKFQNAEILTGSLLRNAPNASMYLTDFEVSDCTVAGTAYSKNILHNQGDIYLSGKINLANNYDYMRDLLDASIMMDFSESTPAIYLNEDFNVSASDVRVDGNKSNQTYIYTLDSNRYESTVLEAFNRSDATNKLMYFDNEIYAGINPVWDGLYAHYNGARYYVVPENYADFLGTAYDGNLNNEDYNQLREVVIPESVTGTLFLNSPYLEKIYLNSSTANLAFGEKSYHIDTLTTKDVKNAIIVPTTITDIGSLNGDPNSSTTHPNKIKIIDLYDTAITNLTADFSANIIDYNAATTTLETVILPKNLQSISDGAFQLQRSLTKVVIPENVTSIGSRAFSGTGITQVVITSPTITIGSDAFPQVMDFYTPKALEDLIYTAVRENNSASAYRYAVYGCETPETIRVDENGVVQAFLSDTFGPSTTSKGVVYLALGWNYINADGELQPIVGINKDLFADEKYTNVQDIRFNCNLSGEYFDSAFFTNFPALSKISVNVYGWADYVDALLDACPNVSSIKFRNHPTAYTYDTAYRTVKGITVDANGLIVGVSGDYASGNITVPTVGYAKTADGQYVKIAGIGSNAFAGSNVTSVTIPVGIYNIADDAFAGANSLTTVTVEDSRASNETKRAAWFASNENIQTINAAVADYTRLDYIKTTGSNSYINTGLKPTNNTNIIMNYMVPSATGTHAVFGASDNSNKGGLIYFHAYSNATGGAVFKPNGFGINHGGIYGKKCNISIIGDTYTFTSGETVITRENASSSTFTAPNVLTIGCLNAGGVKYATQVYVYDFQYYENGELVLDWVPAIKDGVAGMYNRVDGTFKAGGGAGVVAGAEIHNPDAEIQSFSR